MECKHLDKDSPEGAMCEDCYFEIYKDYTAKEQEAIFEDGRN